eukprot:TRINITY_DN5127_c0_g1_i2.p1 TRINITY_DN5127_c0_g1~~TRINITY_DN5127_c0_g1_i2.p1  ORF type:complete len:201 (-),score=22.85 TRINITY_DN5127_c0_g1_i2:133-735(-)
MQPESFVFQSYWIEKGWTSWFVKLAGNNIFDLETASADCEVTSDFISTLDVSKLSNVSNLRSLLFQTGYLTVESHTSTVDGVHLKLTVPNSEVRTALLPTLWGSIFNRSAPTARNRADQLRCALNIGMMSFVGEFNNVLNSIPHFSASLPTNYEGFYQSLLHMTVRLLGVEFHSEHAVIHGRGDMWISTPTAVYLSLIHI